MKPIKHLISTLTWALIMLIMISVSACREKAPAQIELENQRHSAATSAVNKFAKAQMEGARANGKDSLAKLNELREVLLVAENQRHENILAELKTAKVEKEVEAATVQLQKTGVILPPITAAPVAAQTK